MTLKDFFHLSEEAFGQRIAKMSDEELMRDDIHNCRTVHSGAYGAIIGAAEAPMTAGVTLVGSAIGLRRRNVAKRRLEMIHQEVLRRGLPIHKQTKRDYLIPLGIAGVSMGVGAGVMDVAHAIPIHGIIDVGLDAGAAATAQVAQEAAGKLTAEMSSEQLLDGRLPGTGRSRIWAEKLASASSSPFGTTLNLPSTMGSAGALSTPPSPSLGSQATPPLPPRPRSDMALYRS